MDQFKPKSFSEFWPFYVCAHSDPRNRALHFIGTLSGFGFMAAAIDMGRPLFLLGVPVAGYAFAWFGHFALERNKPATFGYPVYSLIGDYKMFGLTILGRMDRELANAKTLMARRRTSN